ncbi:MAG: alpha/beta hydrolase [Mycobacteriaceae bacterium]|uniref:alpha/beta hydrolase n=1 Tax=Corynebacterium sp. TaxID=1720 RepID=UPI003F9CA367
MKHRKKQTHSRKILTALAAAVGLGASLVAAPTAAADPPGCDPYRDGALKCQVFSPSMDRDFEVIVRPAQTPGNPKVAQFIDGANSGETNGWVTAGGALEAMAGEDATLVFPAMDPWSWVQDWDGVPAAQFETFMSQELPGYLEQAFGVPNGGRGSTGVTGLSSGAYGAMNLASKHPDIYSSVYALSGLYDPGMPVQRAVIDGTSMVNSGHDEIPWANEGRRVENNPTLNIDNLNMPVIVSASTGITNFGGDLGPDPIATVVKGGPFEAGTMVMTAEFQARAALAGKDNIEFNYDIIGSHAWDTWRRASFEHGNMYRFMDRI